MAILEMAYQRDSATGQIQFDSDGYPMIDGAATSGANTYDDLISRIQDEVLGSPTTAQIQNAIQDAVATFERQSFWFNQMRYFGDVTGSLSDLMTVAGQEFYSWNDLPALINAPHISKILVLAFANRYPLIERTISWIDDQSVSTTWQGLPTDWCWQANALRLYPVPNGGYPLILDASIRFKPLSASTDYNVWTNRAEPLVRFEAKRLLFVNITRNPLQAAAMEREIYGDQSIGKQGILAQLRRESTARGSASGGRIRASRGYL